MKLKYYLRGLGIGIICTTLVLTIKFCGNKDTMSNEEIISRAKELGMVMQDEGKSNKNSGRSGSMEGKTDSIEKQKGEKTNEGKQTESTGQTQNRNEDAENAGNTEGTKENASQEEKVSGKDEKLTENTKKSKSTDKKISKAEEQKKKTEKTDKTDDGKSNDTKSSTQLVNFEIHSGEFSDVVSKNLFQQGIVDNAEAFNEFVVSNHYDDQLQPGTFAVPKGGSYEEIIKILLKK